MPGDHGFAAASASHHDAWQESEADARYHGVGEDDPRPDPDGLVRFTSPCNRCRGPAQHEVEPEYVRLVTDAGLCERCYQAVERVRDHVDEAAR